MSTEPTQEQEYAQAIKGKTGLKRILNASAYSKDGLQAAYEEQGFRQLIWLNLGLMVLLLCLDFGVNTKMILVFASFLTLIVELFNTSIEAAVDHTSFGAPSFGQTRQRHWLSRASIGADFVGCVVVGGFVA